MTKPSRLLVVGAGERTRTFMSAIANNYSDIISVDAFCEPCPERARAQMRILGKPDIPVYGPRDFDMALEEICPDKVLVISPDNTHSDYITHTLDKGISVISEKPVATTIEQCFNIWETVRRVNGSGADLMVTHNLRYNPTRQEIGKRIRNGEIGQVQSVQMEYHLDKMHMADYFRRWHKDFDKSGSLLVHKLCHDFDLASLWIGSPPVSVLADGNLNFFGRENSPNNEGDHCRNCQSHNGCDVYRDISKSSTLRDLFTVDDPTGYYRDSCVFSTDGNVWDSMAVNVTYRNGATARFNLITSETEESKRIDIQGDDGSISLYEPLKICERPKIGNFFIPFTKARFHTDRHPRMLRIRGGKNNIISEDLTVESLNGGHGDEDSCLFDHIYAGNSPRDFLPPNVNDSLNAAILGCCASDSIQKGSIKITVPYLE
jgi:predicted dehydrogenase